MKITSMLKQQVTLLNLTLIISSSFFQIAFAEDRKITIKGIFEPGTAESKFIFKNSFNGNKLLIEYYSLSKRKLSYQVNRFDECSLMTMSKVPNTRQISINGSCASRGGQIFENIYEWDTDIGNWCLIREIRGESSDILEGNISPSMTVSRVAKCSVPGNSDLPVLEEKSYVNKAIKNTLNRFKEIHSNEKEIKKYLDNLPSYSVAELSTHINPENVREINNIAFYLSRYGRNDDAILLLEKINEVTPRRIVSKLNLADAYWESGYHARAVNLYRKYYDLMLANQYEKKIPDRVRDRMN